MCCLKFEKNFLQYHNSKSDTTNLKITRGMNTYLLASKKIFHLVNELITIWLKSDLYLHWGIDTYPLCDSVNRGLTLVRLYLSWMLNNIYFVSEEKDSPKHVYIYFFYWTSVVEMRKKYEIYS